MKKIVVIGPESTGKSTLCEALAKHFNTLCCPEFARQFLTRHGMNYTYDDLLTIAKGQVALEEEFTHRVANSHKDANAQMLFIDTEMFVMKVWCEFVFGKCHSYILDEIATRRYDLYLLTDTDMEWVRDDLREYPDVETRRELYSIYRHILENQSTPWVNISGDWQQRFEKAVDAVAAL
ncbi:MAG TPA: ATP-binding protein [Chitinophagaceae bacterium]